MTYVKAALAGAALVALSFFVLAASLPDLSGGGIVPGAHFLKAGPVRCVEGGAP